MKVHEKSRDSNSKCSSGRISSISAGSTSLHCDGHNDSDRESSHCTVMIVLILVMYS